MSVHRASPRPDTVRKDPPHAMCICGRPLVFIENVIHRQDHWRHASKVKVLR